MCDTGNPSEGHAGDSNHTQANYQEIQWLSIQALPSCCASTSVTPCSMLSIKTHTKENYAKHVWRRNVRQALADISDPIHLQVRGYNKLRLGLSTEGATEQFISGPYVQMKANGRLFKDERARDWFKGEVDIESLSSASSTSSTSTTTSNLRVGYNVPIWLQGPALLAFFNENAFLAESAVRSTWNPGRFSIAAWRIKRKFPASKDSVVIHDEHKHISISIIPIEEFNALKHKSMANRKKTATTHPKKPSYAQSLKQHS